MLYDYIALLFFSMVALMVPLLFILSAKLLARREASNPVKNAPYESGEATIGSSRDIDNEYLPVFMLFVPLELIIAVLVVWAISARSVSYNTNIAVLVLAIGSVIAAMIGYYVIGVRDV